MTMNSNEKLIELLKTMQENSEGNQRLIELLGQRIDQIWEFLEVAGIAEPIERDK